MQRLSDYGVHLREKQKIRRIYGVLEGQFRKVYKEADRRKGVTGEVLLQLLESRLDTVAYRMGFAASRSESRQVVRHNGVLVNGRRVNIPSYRFVLVMSSKSLRRPRASCASRRRWPPPNRVVSPSGLEVDAKEAKGTYKARPERSELSSTINESLVIELYSK